MAVETWKEVCLIGLIPDGGTEIPLSSWTEDITAMDWGEKDIEGVALVNGGRISKFTPMTDEEITFKVYDTRADDGAVDSVIQLFHKQATADTTDPIVVDNTITRQKFGLIILWAEILPATAGALPTTLTAYRIQAINAYMTKCTPSFDDKTKSAEITFKWTPFNKAGSANKREESTQNSATGSLPAAITTATSF